MRPTMRYDAESNAARIELSGATVLESEEVAPGIVIDFASDGHIVGIEFLDARRQLAQDLLAAAA